MAFTPSSNEEAADAVTRLVDGTLSDAERRDVEAWVNATPDVSHEVSAQARVKHELATGGPPTPQRLLDSVGERFGTGSARPAASKGRGSFGLVRPAPGGDRAPGGGRRSVSVRSPSSPPPPSSRYS
jgi:ferric-dicitrate binding protein FerR (iron transport regulator)